MAPSLLALVPGFPLLGVLVIAAMNRRASRVVAGSIASAAVGLSALISFATLFSLLGGGHGHEESSAAIGVTLYEWMKVGSLSVEIGFLADPLAAAMMCVVTGVGFLIHVYAIGYMDDPADARSTWRFFAYMNLFVFAMLLLVMGDNFLVMFIGWEGVGLCSYLLIGFWFENKAFASAGKKAFVVNRIGDFAFILGMFVLFRALGDEVTFNFAALERLVAENPAIVGGVGGGVVTAMTLLFFGGATGKSAQIPLFVWLPDAMAGPTPVSALIHAATMVTSGIYMICRLNFLFSMAPVTMGLVALVGVLTAFLAATIALSQYDIKKVLAYSTVSQLGYMFVGVGLGAWTAGFFHVVTHAFFKALLFLGAGAVIHALHHEQDMRWMGGLRKHMPWTFWSYVAAWLAIIGTPLFSGFFSKDEILWLAWSTPPALVGLFGDTFPLPRVIWAFGAVTAVLTAFYMSRLMFMTFWGTYRGPNPSAHHGHDAHGHGHGHHVHVHEVSPVMWAPLVVLAVLSVLGGYMNTPHWFPLHLTEGRLHHFLHPVFATGERHLEQVLEAARQAPGFVPSAVARASASQEVPLMVVTLALIAGSVALAWWLYVKRPADLEDVVSNVPRRLLHGSQNKWYVDEAYEALVVEPVHVLSRDFLWKVFDVRIVDGAVNGAAAVARGAGRLYGMLLQVGQVQGYALAIACGTAILVLYFAFSATGA